MSVGARSGGCPQRRRRWIRRSRLQSSFPGCTACSCRSAAAIILERYFNGRRDDDARQRQVRVQERHRRARRHRRRSQAAVARPIRSRSTFPTCRIQRSAPSPIEDLLTMRSGLESTSSRNYGAWVQSSNWVRHALAKPLAGGAGHADDLQHRQHPRPLGDPHEGDRQEHAGSSRRRRSRSRSASRCRRGCAIRRASTSAATKW